MKSRFFKGVFNKNKNPLSNERNERNEISAKPRNRKERRILKDVDRLLNQSKIDVEKHTFDLDEQLKTNVETRQA